MKDWDRREFLKILASLPVAVSIGCESDGGKDTKQAPVLNPEESLKKLIRVFGPWDKNEKALADEFARRFVNAQHLIGSYIAESSKVIQTLAARYPDETMAIDKIHLGSLSAKEKEVLLGLMGEIYSLTEVRFLISNLPPAGQCLGDNTWHTREG